MNSLGEDLKESRFTQHLMADIEALYPRYRPTEYTLMIKRYGGVGAAKRLLADPRHTSYGFEKLWELGELERSVEFAVLLPWFRDLFSIDEQTEAENRLILHEFPVQSRLDVRSSTPPDWT